MKALQFATLCVLLSLSHFALLSTATGESLDNCIVPGRHYGYEGEAARAVLSDPVEGEEHRPCLGSELQEFSSTIITDLGAQLLAVEFDPLVPTLVFRRWANMRCPD